MAPGWYLTNLGGMVAYGAIASSPAACAAIERRTNGRVGATVLRAGFLAAAALHVGETLATVVVTRRRGLRARTVVALALRTLAVGFPSLRAL
jgi:Domain of unknown function (DUF4499)